MKIKCASALIGFLLAFAGGCPGQGDEQVAGQNQALRETRCHAVRLIEDSSNHVRWMLFDDPDHPALPARLVPVADNGSVSPSAAVKGSPHVPAALHLSPIVEAGDVLTVVQNTPVADVRLEAVALGPAALGQTVRVRVKSSGLILPVRIDGPAHAILFRNNSEVRW